MDSDNDEERDETAALLLQEDIAQHARHAESAALHDDAERRADRQAGQNHGNLQCFNQAVKTLGSLQSTNHLVYKEFIRNKPSGLFVEAK